MASRREVPAGQIVMTFDLDREIGVCIAVDISLHQGEVAIGVRTVS